MNDQTRGAAGPLEDSTNTVVLPLPIEAAYGLITDARSYPEWLLGAQEIREVDAAWPTVGTRFHHRIGFGPLQIPGSTTVVEAKPARRFALAAGMGPLGEAWVSFDLEPVPDGTSVTVNEAPAAGFARLWWHLARPLAFALLWGRNEVSMAELKGLADRRAVGGEG